GIANAGGRIDVLAAQIGRRGFQTGQAGIGEVIAVARQPGLLAGAFELADLRVGNQVGGGAVAVVDEREVAVAAQSLIAHTQVMAAVAIAEQDAAGAVVDLGAITGILIIVGAMGIAVEVAQVGAQLAATEGDVMHSTHIMLAIVVFQFAKVVAGGQVVGHLV